MQKLITKYQRRIFIIHNSKTGIVDEEVFIRSSEGGTNRGKSTVSFLMSRLGSALKVYRTFGYMGVFCAMKLMSFFLSVDLYW